MILYFIAGGCDSVHIILSEEGSWYFVGRCAVIAGLGISWFAIPLNVRDFKYECRRELEKEEQRRLDAEYAALPQEEKNKRFDAGALHFFADSKWPEWDVVGGRLSDTIVFRQPLPKKILLELDAKSSNFFHDKYLSNDSVTMVYRYVHSCEDRLVYRLTLKGDTATLTKYYYEYG